MLVSVRYHRAGYVYYNEELPMLQDTPNYKEGSPSILSRHIVPPNKLDNVTQLETHDHQSHDVFDSMDVVRGNKFI